MSVLLRVAHNRNFINATSLIVTIITVKYTCCPVAAVNTTLQRNACKSVLMQVSCWILSP